MSGSKYIIETGHGYLGVHPVSERSRCQITSGTIRPVGFTIGDRLDAVETEDGVALVRSRQDLDSLDSYNVVHLEGRGTPCVAVGGPVLDVLEVPAGGDVRVYERTGSSILLVNAADDPRVAGRPERDHDV